MLSKLQRAQVDAYVESRVAKELTSRLTSQDVLVRELGDKVEDLVWKRIWRYGGLVLALAGVIAWFGYSSFKDITGSARIRLEPIVSDAENRAKQAQSEIKTTSEEVRTTKSQIDALSQEASRQKARLDSQSGEAAAKLAELQRAADKADTIAKGYEAKLDSSIHRLDAQSARVDRAVNSEAINRVYPTIDTEPYATINSTNLRIDKNQKRAGEFWVIVHLTGHAISRQVLTGDKLNQLLSEMNSAGYTSFLGMPILAGRTSRGFEQMGDGSPFVSAVFYFDPSAEIKAEKLAQLVGKYVTLAQPNAQLVTFPQSPSPEQAIVKTYLDKSGIDAQVYISAPMEQ
ncbi:MAG: hypothetical protein WCF30_04975 [Terracidiphilus sp.]